MVLCDFWSQIPDIEEVNTELVFNVTHTRLCKNVTIEDDNILERAESFEILLSSDDPNVLIDSNTSSVTIIDNDGMSFNHCIMYTACTPAFFPFYSCKSWIPTRIVSCK